MSEEGLENIADGIEEVTKSVGVLHVQNEIQKVHIKHKISKINVLKHWFFFNFWGSDKQHDVFWKNPPLEKYKNWSNILWKHRHRKMIICFYKLFFPIVRTKTDKFNEIFGLQSRHHLRLTVRQIALYHRKIILIF